MKAIFNLSLLILSGNHFPVVLWLAFDGIFVYFYTESTNSKRRFLSTLFQLPWIVFSLFLSISLGSRQRLLTEVLLFQSARKWKFSLMTSVALELFLLSSGDSLPGLALNDHTRSIVFWPPTYCFCSRNDSFSCFVSRFLLSLLHIAL